MNYSQQELRYAIDSLQSAVINGTVTSDQARSELLGLPCDSRSSTDDTDLHSGAIHMCPWQTCQATRHG